MIVVAIGLSLMVLERIIPDQKLPVVKGWWTRVIIINACQLGVIFLGALTWDNWFGNYSLFNFGSLNPIIGGFISYIIITFVFYWWHKWRHDSQLLWDIFHQVHHSPSRIETITSFFKHPVEIIVNSWIIGVINFILLGLSLESAAFVLLYTSLAEYFYHMNIKTPHWIGYIIQRPEMHRIHHKRGQHYKNFGDLPIWDIMFGTFENPKHTNTPCGFNPKTEQKIGNMLFFQDVGKKKK